MLIPKLLDINFLADAVSGDDADSFGFAGQNGRFDNLVITPQAHSTNSRRAPSHYPCFRFVIKNNLTLLGNLGDLILSGGSLNPQENIFGFQADRDDTTFTNILKRFGRHSFDNTEFGRKIEKT